MYYSAGSVGKIVLLTVHLDPGTYIRRYVRTVHLECTYWHGSCPATSPGWSCRCKGHRLPWGPPASHQEALAACWAYFQKCCLQAFGWWGLWVTGCEFLLPAVLSGCPGVFLSLLSTRGSRSQCWAALVSPGCTRCHVSRSRRSGW